MEKLPRKWDFYKTLTERRETSWVFLSNYIVLFFNLDMLSNAVAANTPAALDIKRLFPASTTCPFCFVRELPDGVLTQGHRLCHSEWHVTEVGNRQDWRIAHRQLSAPAWKWHTSLLLPSNDQSHGLALLQGGKQIWPFHTYSKGEENWVQINNGNSYYFWLWLCPHKVSRNYS